MKTIKITVKSVSPMLMHSDRTANPLNEHTKRIKAVTSKRKKTDDDHLELARLEFIASCYHNGTNYYIPSANFESMLLASAKHFKLGTIIKQALIVPDDASFDFKMKNTPPEHLFEVQEYVDQRTVKIGTAKTIRTRPIFNDWKCTFTAWLDTDKMNIEEFIKLVENAGRYVGLGDYRPRYGRFDIEKQEVL